MRCVDLEAHAAALRHLNEHTTASQFCAVWRSIPVMIKQPEGGSILDCDRQPVGTGDDGSSGGVVRRVGATRRLALCRDCGEERGSQDQSAPMT
jgi:hypothetical protein